jgi:hypothetical protein
VTPLERLVRAVEQEVTGEEGNAPERHHLALEQARLYTEAVLRHLSRVEHVRLVVAEALERSGTVGIDYNPEFDAESEAVLDWASTLLPDAKTVVGDVLAALAELTRPPIGAKT